MEMKMFVLLLSVCIYGTSGIAGPGWEKYNGHWYYHNTQRLNWIGAQLYCRTLGGNLVHINDAQENNWLASKYTTEPTWIGVTDQGGEDNWRSITTGENVPYTNWSTNNPDNNQGTQHCGTLNWNGNGYWDDDTCTDEFPFICEVGGC
ncbi:perlucin-like protein [Ostrea edulis]|uniref:perlucin-like protein n=1 Tax=Ostrea edulis TaxID=37623 RepID=UPI0024AF6174|nr:perlucin-like protein [Ostrea edulis]